MHIGRTYPWHPQFDATECWFWPWFVAWKMNISQATTTVPAPWNTFPIYSAYYSAVGVVSADRKVVEYVWTDPANTLSTLTCSTELRIDGGVNYCHWTFILKLGLAVLAVGYRWIPIYASPFYFDFIQVGTDVPNPGIVPIVEWSGGGATYEEVGSPW